MNCRFHKKMSLQLKICCTATDFRNQANFHSHNSNKARKMGWKIAMCKFARLKSGRQILACKLAFMLLGFVVSKSMIKLIQDKPDFRF